MTLSRLSEAILAYDAAKNAYDAFCETPEWKPRGGVGRHRETECKLRTALGKRERDVIEAARKAVTHSTKEVATDYAKIFGGKVVPSDRGHED